MRTSTIKAALLSIVLLAGTAPAVASDPACDKRAHQLAGRMKEVIMGWPGKVDEKTPGTLSGLGTLTKLVNEEGRGYKPPRSGHEVKLYRKLKEYLRAKAPGQRLGQADMLRMGMEAAADSNGDVNLAEVYLTVHNVLRLLSRPTQWSSDESMKLMEGDPVYPILLDVQGRQSIDGGESLADLRGTRRVSQDLPRSGFKKGDVADRNYTLQDLFNCAPDGNGMFAPLDGVEEALGNGGAHYYFWLGTITDALGGSFAITGGDWYEWAQKKGGLQYMPVPWARNEVEFARGKMQLCHFRSGGIVADRMRYATGFKNLAAGGYVFFRKRYVSKYCTNNPNIWAPLPLPHDLRRNNVPQLDLPEFEQMSHKLIGHWNQRGAETANLRRFGDGLFKHIRSVRGDQEAAKGAALSWWMTTLATRDPRRVAAGLEDWTRRYGNLNPALRAEAERAAADFRRWQPDSG